MIVTIMSGPGKHFRVRELAPDKKQASTVKWTQFYGDAVEFIRTEYGEQQVRSPEEFRKEVVRRTSHAKAI